MKDSDTNMNGYLLHNFKKGGTETVIEPLRKNGIILLG